MERDSLPPAAAAEWKGTTDGPQDGVRHDVVHEDDAADQGDPAKKHQERPEHGHAEIV
jgi:hypothetical protein